MKETLTVIEFADVSGHPKVKLAFLGPLRIGDRISLAKFVLKRKNGGRFEVLEIVGDFRVTSVSFDLSRQYLSVEAAGPLAPAWRAVKGKQVEFRRVLRPARFPKTKVE